ncbi:DUF4129 domain-containing transglutaminase family protein [Litchfieldia salsa]|uniref:Transglutaminase-like domain-containing protein n=1 Tax=Litchfieldia salsa TaxID=930152 RepID=A0A1H0WS16_9BACI|nr:DUF4129 domain-containing transglutaminase family protein [Litchfieldia salsa]SDP93507.1 protein of unknown function [Litchfieldia salsa]
MTSIVNRNITGFILSVFGVLLLSEWLRPLTVVTDTGKIYVFVLFIGLCFILSFLKIKSWISILIKVFTILFLLNHTYYEEALFNFEWIYLFSYDLGQNIKLVFAAEWLEMSALFRSFLFFILLWLMSYLVFYWMIVQKRIFLFFMITVIYITVLDTFSPYDAEGSIIRLVLFGFLMLGLVNLKRVIDSEKLTALKGVFTKWLIPLIIVIFFTSTVGYLAPKAAPQWPDPVPFLKGYGKGGIAPGGGNGIKKIGYGTNDSYLGGPFIPDDTPVFRAGVEKRHYWRVETKDLYTGKGWEASNNYKDKLFTEDNDVLSWFEAGADREYYEADIEVMKLSSHITYPTGLLSVGGHDYPDIQFSVDPVTEKIVSKQYSDSVSFQRYSLTYEQPVYLVQDVQSVNSKGGLELDDQFFETYTQLPDELPQRVKDLALDITKEKTSRYDKVVAVERYFKEAQFLYDTKNVAVPGRNDDYVDQFLFETQTGYCDNFSTAMIVLLRSLDIPARWVKGYSEGTYIETVNENYRVFEITNNNAHSWVEVYFPNFGWIEFEPTKGFSNLSNFVYNTSTTAVNPNTQEVDTQTPSHELVEEVTPEVPEDEVDTSVDSTSDKRINVSWKDISIYILTVVFIAYVLLKTRLRWLPLLAVVRYKYSKDVFVYFKAYPALLNQLERVGLKRQKGQTLREFATYVDKFYRSEDMQKLTRSYERALYKNDNARKEWEESIELWENLIKKVSS